MNSRTNLLLTRTSVATIALVLSACSGGISVGSNDSNLNDHGSGGAKSTPRGSSGSAGNASDPGSGGSSGPGNSGDTSVTPPACSLNDSLTELMRLDGGVSSSLSQVCARKVVDEKLVIRSLRATNTFHGQPAPGLAVLYVGPVGADPCLDSAADELRPIMRINHGVGEVQRPDSPLVIEAGEVLTLVYEGSGNEIGSVVIDGALDASGTADGAPPVNQVPSALDWTLLEIGGGEPVGANAAACDAPWKPLLAASSLLSPGQERFYCVRRTLTGDVDIGAIRVKSVAGVSRDIIVGSVPPGGIGSAPDGEGDCDATELLNPNLGGVQAGSAEIRYADGAAAHVASGHQLVLRVTGINTSANPYDGPFATIEYQESAP